MGEIKDKSLISFPDNEKPLSPEEKEILEQLHNLGTDEMLVWLRMLCAQGQYQDDGGKVVFKAVPSAIDGVLHPKKSQIMIMGPSKTAYNFTFFDQVHGDVFIRDTARKLSQEGVTAEDLIYVIRRIVEFRAGAR